MNLLGVDDISKEQIEGIFQIAEELSQGKCTRSINESAVLALLFEKPSTRTRMSFEAAMEKLGGSAVYIDAKSTQMARGEPLEDTARVMSFYSDFIVVRMNHHEDVLKFASSASVPVINGLSDMAHPSQALTDMYTIGIAKKRVKGIRIAFTGDIAQNTANSLILAATKLGAQVALIGPKNYPPNSKYLIRAREYGVVDVYDDLKEGLANADIVYTDTFVSMGFEDEAEKRRKMFAPYQINAETLAYASSGAQVMHPLPAFRGEEITADVIDGPRSLVWEQAKNKLLLAQAIILYLSEKRA
ncbi:Ornithine carbamoyltransferase [uncultured archaeon]|nr:Ornithine carbamoyltransferase [uncultured archaeon]